MQYHIERDVRPLTQVADLITFQRFLKAAPTLNAAKSFHLLDKLHAKIGHGIVLCFKEKPVSLSASITAVPISCL